MMLVNAKFYLRSLSGLGRKGDEGETPLPPSVTEALNRFKELLKFFQKAIS